MERVGADGGWGASEMNQGTLSFPASQEIPSNWTHRQDTASKGKKRKRQETDKLVYSEKSYTKLCSSNRS